MSFICPVCQNQYNKLISLSLHFRRGHNKTSKELFVALNFGGIEPTCKCGCGENVKFLDITRGFSKYAWGHGAKVSGKNNWGNNTKANQNSLTTRKNLIKAGKWKPFFEKETGEHWAKGKTAENDIRVAKLKAAILNNSKEIERRSEAMKKNRLNGVIPTLKGLDNSQWKGGISSLTVACRNNPRLYKQWKYPILCKDNFRCTVCSSSKSLEIHHDKETFSEICLKIADSMGWKKKASESLEQEKDQENTLLKYNISDAVADYHIENNISGIVLCKKCHKKQHGKYTK